MKIALIGHGQPRFTNAFIVLMKQLKGFERADFYMNFWSTPWAPTSDHLKNILDPVLEPGFNLKRVEVLDEPTYQLPPHVLNHESHEKESTHWWYRRRRGMWLSLKMAYDLIDEDYDIIIKFRPDGRLDRDIDVNTLDMSQDMIYPSNHRCGFDAMKICDQFVFATPAGMKFYSDMINHIDEYIPKIAPGWEHNVHTWASEHLLGYHMLLNKKVQHVGDYQHLLRVDGVSPNDDHWYIKN